MLTWLAQEAHVTVLLHSDWLVELLMLLHSQSVWMMRLLLHDMLLLKRWMMLLHNLITSLTDNVSIIVNIISTKTSVFIMVLKRGKKKS